jgi:integrase
LVDNVSLLQRRALMVNATVWIPDSNTENGIAEVPLTDVTLQAFNDQIQLAGPEPWLFRSSTDPKAHQTTFKRTWHATLRRAGIPYFRIYDLRATYATRLSAGGVADEWVTQCFVRVTPRSSRSIRR